MPAHTRRFPLPRPADRPTRGRYRLPLRLNRSLLLSALLAGLAAVAVTLVLSGRILRPVQARRPPPAAWKRAISVHGCKVETDDEIGQLAHAFNAMAGSLSQQEQLRRNMVNDVAHEPAHPVANLRGYLDAARDGLVSTDGALVDRACTRRRCCSAAWWPTCKSWRRQKPDA
ncbi:HAMP domain-containing protein [Candidatus Amarolinea dominans]|uniref:HAMP domain-containing protein n=1 Tax=Candidatus Amarolinea dominans TaxID=3140696 RepID=UPI001D8B16DF|nr:HAMP domain-containing protein [Anaerolineae bacterium]